MLYTNCNRIAFLVVSVRDLAVVERGNVQPIVVAGLGRWFRAAVKFTPRCEYNSGQKIYG
jgi:hypothetical protein